MRLCRFTGELGRTSTTTTSLGEAAVRALAGIASGPISLSNLYGKANESYWHASFGSTVISFTVLGTDKELAGMIERLDVN